MLRYVSAYRTISTESVYTVAELNVERGQKERDAWRKEYATQERDQTFYTLQVESPSHQSCKKWVDLSANT